MKYWLQNIEVKEICCIPLETRYQYTALPKVFIQTQIPTHISLHLSAYYRNTH